MSRALILVATCVVVLAGPTFNFRGSGQMKQEQVSEVLAMEEKHDSALLEMLEGELSQMFASLPKNEHGNVGHQAVRYAMHRLFVKRHGWFIRGLEPGNATWTPQRLPNGQLPPAWVKEWVPSFLQDKLEHQPGHHGLTLRDMAALAATIEDLVYKEVGMRLKMVYRVHGESIRVPLARAAADEVLSTFYMTFLLANNLTANSKNHLMKKKKAFAKSYRGFEPAHEWFEKLVTARLSDEKWVDFESASKVVNDIGLQYHNFNQIECDELRATLRNMESKKAGRVRLSVFYNASRFTHWGFTEKAEYLRTLGALDDSDPTQLSLITANYVMARPNCLDASNLYSLCCRNACEDLMAHLEGEIGHSSASPAQITKLVSLMASDSVEVPRELPESLVGRLNEIASLHGGEVPLHGRLFAQWMHHAYPRECPFPHESGSINPQTAEEWTKETGSSEQSTDEERKRFVDQDVCLVTAEGKVECGDEAEELPWNPVEELLTVSHHTGEQQEHGLLEDHQNGLDDTCIVCVCVFIASLVILAISTAYQTGDPAVDCQRQMTVVMVKNSIGAVTAVVSALLLLASLNLLDEKVFAFALAMSFAFYLTSLVAKRNKRQSTKLEKLWS